MTYKVDVLKDAANYLLTGNVSSAKETINHGYPFHAIPSSKRAYTDKQKKDQVKRDGFIDRYSGEKLINPGLLKVFPIIFLTSFPIIHMGRWKIVIMPTRKFFLP